MTQLSLNQTKWTDLFAIIGRVICPCQAQKVTGTQPQSQVLPPTQLSRSGPQGSSESMLFLC